MDWLQNQMVLIGAGAALVFAFGWAATKLPGILGSWLDKKIDALFDAGDEADDRLFLAGIEWVETKLKARFEGEKRGPERMAMLADKIISITPLYWRPVLMAKRSKLIDVLQANYDRLMAELEANKSQHQPPTPA